MRYKHAGSGVGTIQVMHRPYATLIADYECCGWNDSLHLRLDKPEKSDLTVVILFSQKAVFLLCRKGYLTKAIREAF